MNSGEKKRDFLKPTDTWSDVLFADPVAIFLMKILAKLRVHPNTVTILAVFPALFAAYFFSKGDRISLIYGALLWQFSWILDCTDGKLARFTGTTSTFGAKLDWYTDKSKKLAAFLGLLYGCFYIKGFNWFCLGLLLLFWHYIVHFIGHYIYRTKYSGNEEIIPQAKRIIKRVGKYYDTIDEHFVIFFISPLINQVFWGLIISQSLYLAVVIYTILSKHLVPQKPFSLTWLKRENWSQGARKER